MKSNGYIRIMAVLLSMAVTGASIPADVLTVRAQNVSEESQNAEESSEVVHIRNIQELQQFSANCINDMYSMNKVFRLEADIDLNGAELEPVAIFCGTFEGNGHVISGYAMQAAGSDLGFFRFVEKEGTVKDLTVEGKMQPSGTGTHIGGIVGTNRGNIENCRFQGELVGKEAVGGIAGCNEETGIIIGCRNEGKLLGTKKTGGIAGINKGRISSSTNNGHINATTETVREAEGEENSGMNLNFSMNFSQVLTDEEKITSTGGIAGASEGIVESCTNNGTVGYPHVGYRTGGIVGYQRGCIDGCKNNGKVQGRKDTGGIAGLFEPYVEINYEKSTSNLLRTQVDGLIDLFSGLSDITRDADRDTLDNIDAIGDSLDEIKDSVEGYKDYYSDRNDAFIDDMEEALDIVERRIDMLEFDVDGDGAIEAIDHMKSNLEEIQDALNSIKDTDLSQGDLKETVTKLLKDIGYTQEEIEDMLSNLDISDVKEVYETCQKMIGEKISDFAQDMQKQGNKLARTAKGVLSEGKGLADNADKLGTEIKHVIHVAENYAKDFRDDMKATDEDLSAQVDELENKIDVLTDRLRGANDDVIAQAEKITEQMRRINDTTADGLDKLEDKINNPDADKELSDYYDDMSDNEDAAQEKGKILNSVNEGEIISDISGGGIAGLLSVELEAETEFEIEKKGSRSLDSSRNAYATILNCRNYNEVMVKNDYAGGIIGRADLGAVVSCQNYGDVMTEDGDYAGGIAGKSGYLIRASYALCNVTGNNYAGGIAGEGTDIRDSYAMTSILSEEGEKFGAVAGDADGSITGNYFVDDGMAAVNGLTYGKQAAPISYQELISLETTPADFRRFKIRFLAEDKLVKEITCGYGDSLSESDIPGPPEKDGILGSWDKTDFKNIRRNMVVRAVYGDWTTALASGEDIPAVLVAGQFHPDAVLECRELNIQDMLAPAGYEVEKAYGYCLQSASDVDYESLRIHVLTAGGRRQAAVIRDGKLYPVESRQDGSYLVFEADAGKEGEFAVLIKSGGNEFLIVIAVILLVLALLILAVRLKKKKTKKSKVKVEEVQPPVEENKREQKPENTESPDGPAALPDAEKTEEETP